jgi:penicillin V acylase-like amidase (Ntn superfamily)
MKLRLTILALAFFSLLVSVPGTVQSCSRALWAGASGGPVIAGRTMDWFEPLQDKMWVFPRGMERDGATPQNPARWTSKYGSVAVSAYDFSTVEGMNEKGLVAHVLYLSESEYGVRNPRRSGLSTGLWAQYVLDNFASVEEAVRFCRTSDIQLQTAAIGVSRKWKGGFHLALSDRTGDSAIIEYLDGRPVIYHGSKYRVLTNSPIFEKQIANLETFVNNASAERKLPGSSRSTDRFLRASYYINTLPENPKNAWEAVMGVLGVMRNVSAPFGALDPDRPNVMTTIWRSIIDATNGRYYFEYSSSPHMIWVSLDNLDFSRGAAVKMLDLAKKRNLMGDQSAAFEPAAPYDPMRPSE